MSTIDMESPLDGQLTNCYRNAFVRHTSSLSSRTVQRLRRAPGVLICEHATITLGETTVPLVIETLIEQHQPWMWRVHDTQIDHCAAGDQSLNEPSLGHGPSTKPNSNRPNVTQVLELLVWALRTGEEGRDWRLLKRLPAVTILRHLRAA